MSPHPAARRRRRADRFHAVIKTIIERLEDRTFLNGTLDPTFDTDGLLTTHFLAQDVVKAVAVQPDGKIVAVGYESTSNTVDVGGDFAIARYNPDGSLDTTFGGGDGVVSTDFGGLDGAEAVLISGSDAELKIIVAGWTGTDFDKDFALARYNADGSLDTTFDADGKVITPMGGRAYGLIAQPDGKLIAIGVGFGSLGDAWGMARYNTDGSLDTTFGTAGTVKQRINNNLSEAAAGALQPDGRIVLAGEAASQGSGGGFKTLAVARFLPSGALDTSFSGDGFLVEPTEVVSQGTAVEIGGDGSIFVAATVNTLDNPPVASTRLYKYTPAGARDAAFGTGGAVTVSSGGGSGYPVGLAIHEPTGNFLVAATSGSATNRYYGSWTITRVTPDGSLDASFGNDGSTVLANPTLGAFAHAHDLALQPDGHIVVGGTNGADFVLARLTNISDVGTISGIKFEDFDGDGLHDPGEPLLSGQFIYIDANGNGAFDTSSTPYASTDVPRDLTDDDEFVESALTVAGHTGTIADLNVRLTITHTWNDDLHVFLVSPQGTSVELFSDVGSDEDNFIDTLLDDEAAISITDGAAPFTGAFRPQSPLAAFDGEDPNGTWRLRVRDDTAGDTGAIESWSIILAGATPDEPSTLTDAQGRYAFPGLDPGDYVVRDELLPGHVRTAPVSGAHTVTVVVGQESTADFGSRRPGYAGAGLLDVTWDGDGIRVVDPPGTYGTFDARAVAQQSDGKILVAGYAGSGTGSHGDVLLMRLNADSSLDTTFSFGIGYVTTDIISNDNDSGNAILIQPDGKILVAGAAGSAADGDFLLLRYEPDGVLDYAFGGGGNGYVTHDFQSFGDTAYAVALQDDGKIVVTGVATMATSQLATLRYNADGTLDTTFDGDGVAIHDFFGGVDFASDVIIDADEKILVVGGSVPAGGTRQWIMLRYNADGSFDTTFSGNGRVNTPFPATAFAKAVVQQPDGKYIVGGTVDGAFTVGRYNNDGTVDAAFGTDGFTTVPSLKTGFTFATLGLALQPDGKILLGGEHDPGSDSFFAIARFLPDGALDPNFGADGTVAHDTPGFNGGSDLILQADGRIVMVGGGFEVVTARYLNDIPDEEPDFAVLEGGVLTITGTAGDDTIALFRSGDEISATLGGATLAFPAGEVESIVVIGDDGSDTLNIGGDLLAPVSIDLGDDEGETFNITSGFFNFAAPRITGGEHLHVNVANVTGGNVRFETSLTLASLTINMGMAAVDEGADKVLTLGDLTIGAFARLDLADNDIVVRAAPAEREQVLRRLEEYVAIARNTIPRNREGLASTIAAPDSLTGLAVGIVGDDILVKYSWNGDGNGDGIINFDDYFRIDSAYLEQPEDPTYAQGDFNYDGTINFDDYFLIDSAFLGQGAPAAAAESSEVRSTASAAVLSEMNKKVRRRAVRSPFAFDSPRRRGG